MKLKTLKDLWPCMDDEIKEEAIKWVKFCRKNKVILGEYHFRDFHNITEEDLK